jgi:PAS domain S-box-containing protein
LEERVKKKQQMVIEIGHGMAQGIVSFEVGREAARQAFASIRVHAISAVMVFAAAVYNQEEVLQGIHSVVGETPVFGATTAGEICGEIHQGSVSVVVLASPYLRVHCGVGVNVSDDWRRAVDEAIGAAAVRPFFADSEYREKIRRQGRDCFVMFFPPGITQHSDYRDFEILEALKAKLGGAYMVVGGGATDNCLERNQVFLDRQTYSDSILLAVFETELQFGISLTHGFQPTEVRAIVTAVSGDEVLTIDGEVAVDAYSRLVGIPKAELTGSHPVHMNGITLGISDSMGQHTVNLVDSITPRGGIRLSRPVSPGTVLIRMNPTRDNLLQAGAEGIRAAVIRGDITEIALCLICYCSFRPTLLGDCLEQEFAGMREVLSDQPLVGFCCCGEIGVAADGVSRFNTSSIACLVLGGQLSRIARMMTESNELLTKLEAQSKKLARINRNLLKEISERKRVEAALRESETKLKDFARAVPDISLILDEDGRYIELFDSGYQLLKRPKEELKGCTLQQRFPAKITDAILSQIQRTISSGATQCLIYELEIEGQKCFFEGRTAPMGCRVNGKRLVAAVVLDVTERRKAEKMLEFAYELRRKSDFINEIIAGNTIVDKLVSATAKTIGIDFSAPLFCCLLTVDRAGEPAAEQTGDNNAAIQVVNDIIELLSRDPHYLVWYCREGIGVLCQTKSIDDDWENCRQLVLQIQKRITEYNEGLMVKVGVSNVHVGNDSIIEAHRQAWSALVAAHCQSDTDGTINYFHDIGIEQILTNMGGIKQTREFIAEKLGKLIDYDQKKGTNLLVTLEKVLQSNSLKAAAEKMYIHHKTMAFRKQRIERILGVAIDDFETKIALAAALKLHKLVEIMRMHD